MDIPNWPRTTRLTRILSWVLLLLHTLFSLLVFSSIKRSEGWWVISFLVDLPASHLVYMCRNLISNEYTLCALFTVVGSVWQFYWPRVFLLLAKQSYRFFKSIRHVSA